jgi:hypothetical protein
LFAPQSLSANVQPETLSLLFSAYWPRLPTPSETFSAQIAIVSLFLGNLSLLFSTAPALLCLGIMAASSDVEYFAGDSISFANVSMSLPDVSTDFRFVST